MRSTIKEEITRIKSSIQDAYTACANKGATLPSLCDISNLPACIASITQGSTDDDSNIKRADVPLEQGTYDENAKQIVWYMGNGAVRIIQDKASGTTSVNQSFISSPRMYKGHILSFEALNGNKIRQVQIKYIGQNRGCDITAGRSIGDNQNVIDEENVIVRELSTVNDGVHTFSSANGETEIYVQNVSTSANVQLRISDIHIEYIEP